MRLPPPDTSASDRITERLAAITPMIAELEEVRGDALLAGKDFDVERLASLRREQADLECVLDAATRRDRKAAAEAMEAERRQARREVRRHDQARLEAVEQAEKAAVALVAALVAHRETMAGINREAVRLGLRGLSTTEAEKRITRRLATIFRPLIQAGKRYGLLDLPSGVMGIQMSDSWRAGEAAFEAKELARILKENP